MSRPGRSSRRHLASAGLVTVLAVLAGCGSGEGQSATGTASVQRQPVLEPWFDAARSSEDEPATVVVLGDSVSEGYGLTGHLERRWVDQLQRRLRERLTPDCPSTPAGWHGTSSLVPAAYRGRGMLQPARTGATRDVLDAGPGGRSLSLAPGATLTWVVDARQVDVGYRTTPGGGTLAVEVDGAAPKGAARLPTRTTGPAEETERRVWRSGDLGPGSHRVRAINTSPVAGGSVTVTDLRPYRDDRDRCAHVLDASRSGVSLRFVVDRPAYLDDTLALDPDLLVVPLGFNDARAGQTSADFRVSLQRLVAEVRERGYDGPVLLVGLFEPALGALVGEWSDYLRAMQRTAQESTGVSYLDLSAVLPPVDDAPDGVYLDALHPAVPGMTLIADAMVGVLTPRQTPRAPSATTPAATTPPVTTPPVTTPPVTTPSAPASTPTR